MATIIEPLAGANFASNDIPVLSSDPALMCTIGTDFIFDASAASGYSGGVLPAVGAAVPTAGLVNLARDVAPAQSRTGVAVTASPFNVAQLGTFDGKGWSLAFGARQGFQVKKTGVANNRIGEPSFEGWADSLMIAWLKLSALPSNAIYPAMPWLLGQNHASNTPTYSCLSIANTGQATFRPSGYVLGSFPVGVLVQVAQHSVWDNVAGTSTHTAYINGVAVDTRAGPAPSAMSTSNVNAGALFGAQGGGGYAMDGVLYRVQREFPEVSGIDVAAFVSKDYAINRARFL